MLSLLDILNIKLYNWFMNINKLLLPLFAVQEMYLVYINKNINSRDNVNTMLKFIFYIDVVGVIIY